MLKLARAARINWPQPELIMQNVMKQEEKFDKIIKKIDNLADRMSAQEEQTGQVLRRMDAQEGKMDDMLRRMDTQDKRMDSQDKKMDAQGKRMDVQESRMDKVIQKLVDMDAYMHEELATKAELREVESRLTDQVEGFVKIHETLDHEFVSLRAKVDWLETSTGVA